jgi:glycyl-tRNA synthetase beta chain
MNLLAKELRGPVDRFFDTVLVNDPDHPEQQANRKALLAQIEALFGRIADFTRLQLKT